MAGFGVFFFARPPFRRNFSPCLGANVYAKSYAKIPLRLRLREWEQDKGNFFPLFLVRVSYENEEK